MKQQTFILAMAVVVLALPLASCASCASKPEHAPPAPEAEYASSEASDGGQEESGDGDAGVANWEEEADGEAADESAPEEPEPPSYEQPSNAGVSSEEWDRDRYATSAASGGGGSARPMATPVQNDSAYAIEGPSRRVVAEIPIALFPGASYAFVTPPGLRYRERLEVLFQVDPTTTALEGRDRVQRIVDEAARLAPAGQQPTLRGEVEATTGPWSRCMEAELHETTVSSNLMALELEPDDDRTHLEICELEPDDDRHPRGTDDERRCLKGPNRPRRLGLHPTEWRWRIEGARAGRAQLMLRLYAVAQQENDDGSSDCIARDPERPGSYRRIRTFQRRMTVEVSAAERIEKAALTPWLWSLIFPPLGILFALYRRSRARGVLP